MLKKGSATVKEDASWTVATTHYPTVDTAICY